MVHPIINIIKTKQNYETNQSKKNVEQVFTDKKQHLNRTGNNSLLLAS